MKIYLIRHAESVGNTKGSLVSTTDFELTGKGKLQAQRVGEYLYEELKGKEIVAYCSPLLRARQTLQGIFDCMAQKDIKMIETDDLKEMDLGILEGMPFDEQLIRYPEIDLAKRLSALQAPEGESYQDMKLRVGRFVEQYISKPEDNRDILIVSHGITLRILTNLILKRPDEDVNSLNWLENTAHTVLVYDKDKDGFCIERLNDYSHLQELKTANYNEWGLFAEPNAYYKTKE